MFPLRFVDDRYTVGSQDPLQEVIGGLIAVKTAWRCRRRPASDRPAVHPAGRCWTRGVMPEMLMEQETCPGAENTGTATQDRPTSTSSLSMA